MEDQEPPFSQIEVLKFCKLNDMFPEHQRVIEVEPKVPPVQLGPQGYVPGVWGETKVNGGAGTPLSTWKNGKLPTYHAPEQVQEQ